MGICIDWKVFWIDWLGIWTDRIGYWIGHDRTLDRTRLDFEWTG